MSSLKNDCSLFSRLYIASQIRHRDLDEFFQHENQACPPSLSQLGGLRMEPKSDLMPCLKKPCSRKEDLSTPRVQVNILDGDAIINMLRPGTAKTFQGYATDVFVPALLETGEEFLRINDNKTELFSFLASNVADIDTNKHLITTQGTGVLCSNRQDVSALAPCTHEEADTRILLYLQDAVQQGVQQSVNTPQLIQTWGKKTAWDTWTTYGDVTPAFCALGAMPDPRAIDEWMQPLERFFGPVYDRTRIEEGVNQAQRKQLF
ncbi:hypothetical protein GWK47_034604 [Chionoecetes opilio]|uniref:Uncharacterized protein n=1 Tax=Chionoecetes opilio TaxID=41210 RepID=A0A8J4YUP7_CHIOP|nr:hypothetical protein GWK47_034604 [Chionoecetes opilio]